MLNSLFKFENNGIEYRLLNRADRAFFIELYSDNETMEYVDADFSSHRAVKLFKQYTSGAYGEKGFVWLVKINSTPIGFIGLSKAESFWELGIVLSPAVTGKGWGAKVMSEFIGKIFATGFINEVKGRIRNKNIAATQSVQKVGFVFQEPIDGDMELWVLQKENLINGK